MRVYLDHAATSPVKPQVYEAMEPYLHDKFGNPSSIHSYGQEARKAIDEARERVAKFFNCQPDEIIFTSGGTEANNLAIIGVISKWQMAIRENQKNSSTPIANGKLPKTIPHIITSKIEHHAVLETCEYLEKQGLAEVTYIGVDKDGLVDPLDVKKAIKDNTTLVTIMYANNEVGTIQPIREIGKIIEKENRRRLKEVGNEYGNGKVEKSKNSNFPSLTSKPTSNFFQPISTIYFHTDAVQAAGYLDCDVLKLHVHMMTIAGHKIGAPKGVGALYIRKGVKIAGRLHGGAQEYGIRPGTENVAGIVGLGKAVEILLGDEPLATTSRSQYGRPTSNAVIRGALMRSRRVTRLRNKLKKGLLNIKDSKINGNLEKSVPHILNISFAGVEGESILLSLDQEGIATSTGSACTSQSLDPSHVIMAMYNDLVRAHSSVRFSLGEETSKDEIDYTIEKMKSIIKRLRSFSPTYKENSKFQ